MKLARILFGCCLSYTSANSAISAISGINSGEFRIYIIYNTCMGDQESLEAGGALVEEELKWRYQRQAHRAGGK